VTYDSIVKKSSAIGSKITEMDFSKNQGSSKKKGSSDGSSLGAGGIKEFIAQTTMIGNF